MLWGDISFQSIGSSRLNACMLSRYGAFAMATYALSPARSCPWRSNSFDLIDSAD